MTPSISTNSTFASGETDPILRKKTNGHTNGVNGSLTTKADDALEDYSGNYKFAPIEEAQVARAMIKRCLLAYDVHWASS